MSSGVEFEEDKIGYSMQRPGAPGFASQQDGNEPKMVRWLMKKGIVKTAKAGEMVLTILIVLNFIITFIFIRSII